MPRLMAPTPRHHERVTIRMPGEPVGMRVVLTETGPLQTLVDYFVHLGGPSPTVQRNTAMAVGLLWDYYVATRPSGPAEYATFLTRFVRHLATGTVANDGSDPLDLNWYPMSPARAKRLLSAVTDFTDYCALVAGTESLNALVPATFAQRIAHVRRLSHQSAASLLKHLFNPAAAMRQATMARRAEVKRVPTKEKNAPPFFPFAHTMHLLEEGFRRRPDGPLCESHHVRDMMIAVLQRFGGLRVSEPFHLFVQDVTPVVVDPLDEEWGTVANVRVFHPTAGAVTYTDRLTGRRENTNRAEYLLREWGRLPRHEIKWGGEWAGWKDPLLDDDPENFMTVHWFPRVMGAYFWRLYLLYLRHLRPTKLDHPYLFVNLDASQDGTYGAPYRIESYTEKLAKAVTRIGLPSKKANGTTSHGLRHAYAQSLRAGGVSEKAIMIAMHHKSPLSQHVYTRPSKRAAAHELDQADARARGQDALARSLRHALPGEIDAAETRLRALVAGDPPGLSETFTPRFPPIRP